VGKLNLDFSIYWKVLLAINFFALAIVDPYLSRFGKVTRKSKPDPFCEGIGKGDDIKGKYKLVG